MISSVKARGGLGHVTLLILSVYIAFSAAGCSEYTVQTSLGTAAFNHLSFIDFRSVANPSSIPKDLDDVEREGLAGITSPYFNTEAFSNWSIQTWSSGPSADAPLAMHYLAQNVFISSFC